MMNVRSLGLLVTLFAVSFAFAETKTVTLEVRNMVCNMCSAAVTKALSKVPGVQTANVELAAKQAIVVFDPAKTTPEALTRATAAVGFPSAVKQTQ